MVFLGTSWAELEHHNTRWRAVTTNWAQRDDVSSVRVVDLPRFGVKAWLRSRHLTTREGSWHPSIGAVEAVVPLTAQPGALDAAGWALTSRALRRLLRPARETVGIAASPLWCPALPGVGFGRVGFDAVDDLRFHSRLQHVRARVEQGYALARDFDFATAVSAELAGSLAADVGLTAEIVPNGVDLDLYQPERLAELPREIDGCLPTEPFAVYVGRLNAKIDFPLLGAVAARMPVVLAGPATDDAKGDVVSTGATWLGPVDTRFVPALLARASVGLVPFVVDELTRSMDSMKVLEYLASGLDVVATPLPALAGMTPRIHQHGEAAAFAAAARAAAARGRHGGPDAAVAKRSWAATADRLLTLARGD